MKFEMTKCKYCGGEMLMGATLCPSCGQTQTGYGKRGGFYQPGVVLAVALSAAVLFFFNYINPRTPHASQLGSPPSVTLPTR
jgi:hypothetical protein